MDEFCEAYLKLAADWWWQHDFNTATVKVSPSAARFLGFSEGEVLPLAAWENIVHPNDRKHARVAAENAVQTMQPRAVRVRYRAKKGIWKTLFCRMQPFSRDGEVVGILGINREIDDVLAVEDEILQRNEDLAQVASILSHDFRGPARHIAGCTERISGQVAELCAKLEDGVTLTRKDFDELEHWTVLGRRGSERMGKMIEHVLQYSRAGTKGVRPESIDSADVVADVLRDYAERIEERGMQVSVAALPTVLYDRTMLYLVLANLISNGIKFSKKTDTAPVLEIFGRGTSMGYASITVRDHGIGISAKYTEKILDMGFRLHHESEYAGFGYGLAIVRKILKRCGGELGVRSQIDKGSDFVVTLQAGKTVQA